MNGKVFLYWVGSDYKLIKILRDIIYYHSNDSKNYEVILINDKNVRDYVDIPDFFFELLPAYQADIVRVNVLYKYGGIWLDSDTIVMDNLDSLFTLIENKNGFFVRENNQFIVNGVFGTKPNTPLMYQWKNYIDNILKTKKKNIEWTELGSRWLNKIENFHLFKDYDILQGLDTIYPVNWDKCVEDFLNKPYDNYVNLIRDFQPLIVLVNSVYKELENFSEIEIKEGSRPLNYFLNKSLEKINFK